MPNVKQLYFWQDETFEHGWFVVALCSFLVTTLVLSLKSFQQLIREFTNPYGDDPVDYPVISWVCGVIHESSLLTTHLESVAAELPPENKEPSPPHRTEGTYFIGD